MPLAPGTRLGSYEILGPLGQGGMGEVYKARDTELDRDVAIKVLPESWSDDPDRLMRFEREARALAALNHRNIAQVYATEGVVPPAGSEEVRPPGRALVLEFVDGEDLSDRIGRGPLPIPAALQVAGQIADGLEAAHEAGIIHRDLKPANIKITRDGTVKLLDFGLAKGVTPMSGGAGGSRPDASAASTMLSPAGTEAGLILGTTAYMSPEQASGTHTDQATDLWAFGVVLFEMLTGRRPFAGETNAHLMAAILQADLDWSRLPAGTPAPVRRLLRRCLERDPRRRLRDAREARVTLEEARVAPEADEDAPVSRQHGLGLVAVAGLMAAAVAATAAVMWWGVMPLSRGDGEAPAVVEAPRRVTFEGGLETHPSISPDGTQVAYAAGVASRMRVYIQSVTGGRPRPLSEDADPYETQPAYSPTGESILFLTAAGAFRAPALGGPAVPIALAPGPVLPGPAGEIAFPVSAAAWSPDGQRVFIARGPDMAIAAIAGGAEVPLGRASDDLHSCAWSPGGLWIACTEGNANSVIPGNTYGNIAPSTVVLISAEDGAVREITDRVTANLSPAWSADGDLLFFVSNRQGPYDLFSVRVDDSGRAQGEPVRVTTGLDVRSVAISAGGAHVVYETYSATANLWSLEVPAGTAPGEAARAEQVTSASQLIESMHVSDDGRFVLYDSNLSGNADIYRVPAAGGTPVQLTDHSADDFAAALSPDGREFAYHSWRTGSRDIFVQPVQGGTPQQLTGSPSQESYPRWAPDGRRLSFFDQAVVDGQAAGLFLIERTGDGWGDPVLLKRGAGRHDWLPGGDAIVYERQGAIEAVDVPTGTTRVVYAPAAGDATAESVELSEDGRLVYFKSHDARGRAAIWSVPVEGGRPQLRVRFADDARPSLRADFSIGGSRFYFTTEDRQSDVWVAGLVRR